MKNIWKTLSETVRQHKKAAVCAGLGLGAATLIAVIALIAVRAGAAAVNGGKFLKDDLTRAEWIELYGKQFDLCSYQQKEAYYSDVDTESELFAYVQTFVENDILQAAERLNGAEKITAREALLQLAKGFGDSYIRRTLKKEAVTDDDRLAFLKENAGISVETLSGGLGKEQAQELLSAAWEYYLNRPFSNQTDIVYQEQVKDLSRISEYSYDDGKLTVADNLQTADGLTKEEAERITAGTVLVLGASASYPEGLALKVTGVEKNAAGYVWSVTEPELGEVVESLYLEFSQIADFDDFVPEEGVRVLETDGQDTADAKGQSLDGQEEGMLAQAVGENALNQTFAEQNAERLYGVSFNADKKGKLLKMDLNLTDGKAKVSPVFEQYGAQLDISNASLYQYAVDESGKLISKFESGMEIHGGLTVKDLILNGTVSYEGKDLVFDVNTGITVQPSLSIKGNAKGKQYKIGTFSIPISFCVSAKAEMYLCVDFEGELSVKPQLTYTLNAKKKPKGGINFTGKTEDRFECELGASAKVSGGPDITFRFLEIDLVDVYGFAGVGAKATYSAQTADKVTVDVYGPTLEVGAGNNKNTLLSRMGLKAKVKVFDESGALKPCPFRVKYTYDVLRKKLGAEVVTTPEETSGNAEEIGGYPDGTPSGGVQGGTSGTQQESKPAGSGPTGSGPAESSDTAEGIIPEGATYYVAATKKTLTAGERFPAEPAEWDEYTAGDYWYLYEHASESPMINSAQEWNVHVRDKSKSRYGKMLAHIAGKPVKSAIYTFYNCTSLKEAPVIPSSVWTMSETFSGCTSLTGTLVIHAKPTHYDDCFSGVDFSKQNLTLSGSSSKLEELRKTGKN